MNDIKNDTVHPGDTIHFLAGGLTYTADVRGSLEGFISKRGDELILTAATIDVAKDRFGASWLSLLDDPERQIARWGRVMFGPGPFPSDLLRTELGQDEHEKARRAAVRDAQAFVSASDRTEALRQVDRLFGPAASTSKTLTRFA